MEICDYESYSFIFFSAYNKEDSKSYKFQTLQYGRGELNLLFQFYLNIVFFEKICSCSSLLEGFSMYVD